MEQFADYGHAIVAIAIWVLIAVTLGPITAAMKTKAGMAPGETPKADYTNLLYRMERSHLNTTETLFVLVAAVFVAILAGVSPFWVNWLASLSLLLRIVMIYVHIKGFGKPVQGLRTGLFVLSWAMHVALAIMAIAAVF